MVQPRARFLRRESSMGGFIDPFAYVGASVVARKSRISSRSVVARRPRVGSRNRVLSQDNLPPICRANLFGVTVGESR
jgi:hypothetical protein